MLKEGVRKTLKHELLMKHEMKNWFDHAENSKQKCFQPRGKQKVSNIPRQRVVSTNCGLRPNSNILPVIPSNAGLLESLGLGEASKRASTSFLIFFKDRERLGMR